MSSEVSILLGLLLLLGNAFFVGAEFSLVSVRRSAIEPKAIGGSKRARLTLRALENLSVLMAGAQLGITLCSLGLGAVAEPAVAHLLDKPFEQLHISHSLLHPLSFAIALSLITFLHVVIGEMVPKNIALAKPERTALILTPMLVAITRVFGPLVHSLNFIANNILKLAGIRPRNEVGSTYTRDEMADLVEESRKEGFLDEDDESLLSGALNFDEQTVGDIAVPIEDMVTVTTDFSCEKIELVSTETGYSRFPIRGKRGKIKGYIHIKDIVGVDDENRGRPVPGKFIRELAKVSHTQSIRMTLKIMQRSGSHMALVTRGKNIVGVVTLADVLEELVGEMHQAEKRAAA